LNLIQILGKFQQIFTLHLNRITHTEVVLTAAPTLPFVAVTSTHWRSFMPPVTATAPLAIMTMSPLAAALGELLDLFQNFFKHFLPTSFLFYF
jgi:hypothetical protein